jgi:hypothetical protein
MILETMDRLQNSMLSDASHHISDADLAEVQRLAAQGRRIPDIVLKAIMQRVDAAEAARRHAASAAISETA